MQAPDGAVKGFHLLVWSDGTVRVFGARGDGHKFGEAHWPEFDGRFSLWLLIRLWWKCRK
jgi:hypothetical protein